MAQIVGDWLTVSVDSGSGNGTFSVTAAANTGAARSASIDVAGAGGLVTRTISVSQAAALVALTISADTGGSITTGTSGNYGIGTTVAVAAAASSHYAFSKWQDKIGAGAWTDVSGLNASGNYTVKGAGSLKALFARTEYQLSLSVNSSTMGKVKIGTGTASSTASTWVGLTSSVTYTAVPNDGYVFKQWSDGNTSASRTFANPTADLTLTATFEAGTLTVSPTSLSFIAAGEQKTVTVTSNIGWTTELDE